MNIYDSPHLSSSLLNFFGQDLFKHPRHRWFSLFLSKLFAFAFAFLDLFFHEFAPLPAMVSEQWYITNRTTSKPLSQGMLEWVWHCLGVLSLYTSLAALYIENSWVYRVPTCRCSASSTCEGHHRVEKLALVWNFLSHIYLSIYLFIFYV